MSSLLEIILVACLILVVSALYLFIDFCLERSRGRPVKKPTVIVLIKRRTEPKDRP